MSKKSKALSPLPHIAPTIQTAAWGITDFLGAADRVCKTDKHSHHLRMYFYAATESGWRRIKKSILSWRNASKSRAVTAYIGTDHGLTDPAAIEAMLDGGIDVRLMRHYRGIFHPKVIWFVGKNRSIVLAGSNNLTEDGLRNNIEFATVTELSEVDANLQRWHDEICNASESATKSLIKSYASEKEKYGEQRARSGHGGNFTWSKRTSGNQSKRSNTSAAAAAAPSVPGLILEVMPRETSEEGRQVQIPLAAARSFFGLGRKIGGSVAIDLNNVDTTESRTLTLTLNKNSTARLTIRELEYDSRPCVLVFTKQKRGKFDFELVRRAIDPSRFDKLIAACKQSSPRRWKL